MKRRMKKKKKQRKRKTKFVKFCPKCKSLNISINYRGGLVALGMPPIYQCRKCGYSSYFFPEVVISKLKKKKAENKKE